MRHYTLKLLARWRSVGMLALLLVFNALPALAENIKTEVLTQVIVKDAAMIAKATAALEAIKPGNKTKLKSLISKGLNVNMQMMTGGIDAAPLLWVTVEQGKKKIVEFLLNKGADVNLQNVNQQTLLRWTYKHLAVVQVLIEHGANINAQDRHGNTVLMIADWKLAKFPLAKGADVNIHNRNRETALNGTCYKGPEMMIYFHTAKA
ncbi:MAG: ankyrin repeat domain-containing protein [Mariprofundus sp.]|nr:ankyrin repeat domain-containing protein [Mariprofundus sp.]